MQSFNPSTKIHIDILTQHPYGRSLRIRNQPGQQQETQQETQQQNTQNEQTTPDDDSDRSPQPLSLIHI